MGWPLKDVGPDADLRSHHMKDLLDNSTSTEFSSERSEFGDSAAGQRVEPWFTVPS